MLSIDTLCLLVVLLVTLLLLMFIRPACAVLLRSEISGADSGCTVFYFRRA